MTGPGRRRQRLGIVCSLLGLAAAVDVVTRAPEHAGAAVAAGYWMAGTDGGVFAFGRAGFFGSTGDIALNQPVVGIAATPTGRGYWMAATDGGVFAFGDARFHGSLGGVPLRKPIVAIASTPTGRGYWMAAADGGMFAFGDAGFHGSLGGEKLRRPIVDMAATPSGRGYWMAASDGGVFAFGDAGFHGSAADVDLALRIHALAPTPSGTGYWMVAGDGGVFAFGDAAFHGSAVGAASKRVLDMAPSASGRGYYVTASNGQVLAFGDARSYGGTDDVKLNHRIAAMTVLNGNEPPVAVDDVVSLDEDGSVVVDVFGNDRDPDGDPLSLTGLTTPQRGSATMVGRRVVYQPAPDFFGADSFSYTVVDDRGASATGRVDVTVHPVDDVPEAVDDSVTLFEDTAGSVPVLANDRGLGDGVKTVLVVGRPDHGGATVESDFTIRYVPPPDFNGTDSFRYRVVDGDDDRDEATVDVTVLPANDVPVAVDDGPFTIPGGEDITVEVLENDHVGDGRPQIRLVAPDSDAPTEAGRIAGPAGDFERHEGRIRFTPAAGFVGVAEGRYVVVDEDGRGDVSNPATVTIDVTNGPPRARDHTVAIDQGETARGTLRAEDPEGDPLTFRVVDRSGPAPVGLAVDGQTGEFAFGPVSEPGTYTFGYVASDGSQDSDVATVTIDVEPRPQQPPPAEESPPATSAVFAPPLMAAPGRRRRSARPGL